MRAKLILFSLRAIQIIPTINNTQFWPILNVPPFGAIFIFQNNLFNGF